MKIRSLLSNSGYSLIFALVALATITGTTAYLLDIKQTDVKQSSKARAVSLVELERSRISAALSDNTTCMEVFGGQARLRGDILNLSTTAPAATIIAKTGKYYNEILTVSLITTRVANAGEFPGILTAGTDKNYVLEIRYFDATAGHTVYTGKPASFIYIPMYMKGSPVTECYALAQNSEINLAIKDSCSPGTAATLKNSLLGSTGTIGTDCTHTATFAAAAPENTTCMDDTIVPTQTNALIGFDLIPGTKAVDVPASKCVGIATACAAFSSSIWRITNSSALCGTPGIDRANPCGPGQVLYKNGASNYTCITVSCPAADFFVREVNSAGAVCFEAPTTTCGPNQYVKDYNAAGVGTCAPLPIMSGTCGGNDFGSSLTRASAGNNGSLNCAPVLAKQCSTPARTNFATHFNDITTADCTEGAAGGVGCNSGIFSLGHLNSVTAFQASSVPFGGSCISEVRTCNNGLLSGSYPASSCSISCNAQTINDCNLAASPNGTNLGTCTGGYFGDCNYSCVNGVWSENSNTCSATPLATCPAYLTAHCELNAQPSGGNSGSCEPGYFGVCDYNCVAGTWTYSTNTCSLPFGCSADPEYDFCVLDATANTATDGQCLPGYTGICDYVCNAGVWSSLGNTCAAPRCIDGPFDLANTQTTLAYSSPTVPYGTPGGCTSVQETRTCSVVDIAGTWTGVLSGTFNNASCTVDPPAPCAAGSVSNCNLTGPSAHGANNGTCAAGFTGTCDYTCDNGSWSAPSTNTCMAPCLGTTVANCDLPGSANGTSVGSCASGYAGACSFTCNNGVWNPGANTCVAATAPCAATTIANCTLGASAHGVNTGSCTAAGACNYTCNNGTWDIGANTCL